MGIFDDDEFDDPFDTPEWRKALKEAEDERDKKYAAEEEARELEHARKFKPYAAKHSAKIAPINTGSWSGRGTRGIIPYENFDYDTLMEAIAIINGTSQFYKFDEQGKLQSLLPEGHNIDTYKDHVRRHAELTKLRGPNNAAKIRTVEAKLASLREQQKAANLAENNAHSAVGKLEAKEHSATEKLRNKGEQETKAERAKLDEIVAKVREMSEGRDGKKYSRAEIKAVADEYTALMHKINQKIWAKAPMTPKFHADLSAAKDALKKAEATSKRLRRTIMKTEKELEERTIIADGDQYDVLKAEFDKLMTLGDNKAISTTDRDRRWDLSHRLSNATALLDPARARSESDALAKAADTIGTRTSGSFDEMLGIGKDLSPKSRKAIHASIAILANVALRGAPEDPVTELGKHMKLTAISKHGGSMGSALSSMHDMFDMEPRMGPMRMGDWITSGLLEEIEVDIDQLRALDNGAKPPENLKYVLAGYLSREEREHIPKKYIHPDDLDGDEHDYYKRKWDKNALLRHVMHNVEGFERDFDGDNIMRFHNSHPDAVNFIMAARDAHFLSRSGAHESMIHDIPGFANSYWMNMVGNIDLTVSPQLLAQTRDILKHEPLREQTGMELP